MSEKTTPAPKAAPSSPGPQKPEPEAAASPPAAEAQPPEAPASPCPAPEPAPGRASGEEEGQPADKKGSGEGGGAQAGSRNEAGTPKKDAEKNEKKKEKKKPRYSNLSNIRYVLAGIREYDPRLLPYLALNILCAAAIQFIPVLMPKYLINEAAMGGSAALVVAYSAGFGALLLLARAWGSISRWNIGTRFVTVRLRFIARAGAKFIRMDYQKLEDPDVLDLAQKGDRAIGSNNVGIEGIMHRVQEGASSLLVLLSAGTVIALLNPLLVLAILLLLAVNQIILWKAWKKDKEENDALSPVWRKLWYLNNEAMSNFQFGKDVRLFSLRHFLLGQFDAEVRRRLDGQSRIWRLWMGASVTFAFLSLLQEILLYVFLIAGVIEGRILIGDFLMYSTGIHTFINAVNSLMNHLIGIRQQNEVVADYREFLDLPDIPDGGEPVPDALLHEPLCFAFRHVTFRYPGQDQDALHDVSFTIRPGERLAVVGLNGAGKSTFLKLLTRLYEPDEGEILLNGKNVRDYRRADYFRLFAPVFQETQLFAFIVAENVGMKEPAEVDRPRVERSLQTAGLWEKIAALPGGIDHSLLKVVREDGVELSGGESAKLALARALYKDAPCILLDEPTAALDSLAEERLYQQFDGMTQGKTALYISHRLASTRFCDRIAVLEGGRVIEEGTHDSLMARSTRYAELFETQAKYYRKETEVPAG